MSVANFARVIGRRVFRQSFVLIYGSGKQRGESSIRVQKDKYMVSVPGDSKTCSRATVKGVSRRDKGGPKKQKTHLESKGNRRT